MATAAENLNTAYTQLCQHLADVTADPRPEYQLNGQSVSWVAYTSFIIDKLKTLEEARQRAESPFWSLSKGKA